MDKYVTWTPLVPSPGFASQGSDLMWKWRKGEA